MEAQAAEHTDLDVSLPGGPAAVPEIQLVHVSEARWARGYSNSNQLSEPTWILMVTVEGLGQLRMKDQKPNDPPVDLPAGHFLIFQENRLDRHLAASDRWVNNWFQFEISVPQILPLEQVLPLTPGPEYQDTFRFIHKNLVSPEAVKRRRAASRFASLLFDLIDEAGVPTTAYDREQPVQRAVDLMRKHLYDRKSMDEIAESVGLTPAQLRKAFMRDLQATPNRYYNWMRMYEARRLILDGLSVGEIADKMHYSDQFHFTRAFRTYFAKSPTQLVNDLRSDDQP